MTTFRAVMVALATAGAACAAGPRLESTDILARNAATNESVVQHILIGWGGLSYFYDGPMDPRAAARSRDEAEALVRTLVQRAQSGEAFDALVIQYSEDAGTAREAQSIAVTPQARLVKPFITLGLRLKPGEIGVVRSDFGFHIMKRVR